MLIITVSLRPLSIVIALRASDIKFIKHILLDQVHNFSKTSILLYSVIQILLFILSTGYNLF
jgi:hypothetical protein